MRTLRLAAVVSCATALAACSYLPSFSNPFGSSSVRPKPAELAPVTTPLISVSTAWTAKIGAVGFPLIANVVGNNVTVASTDGTVASIDASTGRDVWRASIGSTLTAGVGSDGRIASVVTTNNDLVVLDGGKELWRQRLTTQVFTTPLVAGGRVFVLGADRSVSAFDGMTGRKLWSQTRANEPLVLRRSGVLLGIDDTLIAGLSNRMVGMNPGNGVVRWETPVATARGTNDVERLIDIVAPASRAGNSLCARSFQAGVGCVDANRGSVVWSKPANGDSGLTGDAEQVFGTEADGKVVAWRRDNGERSWTFEQLMWRHLSSPLLLGRSIVVGDDSGNVHLLSRQDGAFLNRLTTDGSAIAVAPVVASNRLIVVTRNGGVFAFQPN